MQKEGTGVIAADKDLRGEHGCCLGHSNSVLHLLQVNQELIKYLLFRVWRPYRSPPHRTALDRKVLYMWQTLSLFTQIPPSPDIKAKFKKKQLAGFFSKQ